MRVVLVLVVRDEEDILESMLSFHLATGVDHVVATDHRSRDATPDVLRAFERTGRLTYQRDDRQRIDQGRVTTRMARFAAVELGADWVVCADADELWWSREGRLDHVLAALPARYSVVRGVWRHFALRPDDERAPLERMTIRRRADRDLTSPYQRQVKVAFRASEEVVVESGGHGLTNPPAGQVLRGWYPFEVLHFPYRSAAQLARKVERVAGAPGFTSHGRHLRSVAAGRERSAELHAALCPSDDALVEGLARGDYVEDVRARDALRAIRLGARPVTAPPTPAEDADFAIDVDLLMEVDSAARIGERLAALERRVVPGAPDDRADVRLASRR